MSKLNLSSHIVVKNVVFSQLEQQHHHWFVIFFSYSGLIEGFETWFVIIYIRKAQLKVAAALPGVNTRKQSDNYRKAPWYFLKPKLKMFRSYFYLATGKTDKRNRKENQQNCLQNYLKLLTWSFNLSTTVLCIKRKIKKPLEVSDPKPSQKVRILTPKNQK